MLRPYKSRFGSGDQVKVFAYSLKSRQSAVEVMLPMCGDIAGAQQRLTRRCGRRHYRIGVDAFFYKRHPCQAGPVLLANLHRNYRSLAVECIIAQFAFSPLRIYSAFFQTWCT